MDDRALLEAAAKAAGITIKWFEETDEPWCFIPDRHPPHNRRERDKYSGTIWNPLDDDGDALRLAVTLNIPVIPYDDETSTGTVGVVAKNWGSKEANTRRAIVRAAAEIGKDAT